MMMRRSAGRAMAMRRGGCSGGAAAAAASMPGCYSLLSSPLSSSTPCLLLSQGRGPASSTHDNHHPHLLPLATAARTYGNMAASSPSPAARMAATTTPPRHFSTSGGGPPEVHELWVLKYDYVADILQKRDPHRAGHLSLLKLAADKDLLVLGGALSDPVDTGLLVFSKRGAATSFVNQDPYVKQGLVTNWSIRPWSVVVGSLTDKLPTS